MRGVKSRCLPRMLPPNGPVASSQSPALAPARVDRPTAGRLAEQRHRDDERAVPAVRVAADDGRIELIGHFAQPGVKLLAERPAAVRGRPTLTTAATGRPAIAAMSLRLTAIALRPTRRGPASARDETTALQQHVGRDREPGASGRRTGRRRCRRRGRAAPAGRPASAAQPVDEGEFAGRNGHADSPGGRSSGRGLGAAPRFRKGSIVSLFGIGAAPVPRSDSSAGTISHTRATARR